MKRFRIAILTGGILLGASGACLDRGIEVLRQALLPPDASVGNCFELAIGDSLIEIPCSVLD